MTKNGMRIHPVRTEQEYDAALGRIQALMHAAPGSAEGDELDVLATLVDAYEAKHFAMDAPSPIAAIEFRMEQQGMTRKDLEPYIGSRARVSEILTGRRPLTLHMIERLRDGLGISADVLVAPSRTGTRPTVSAVRNAHQPGLSGRTPVRTAKAGAT